MVVISCSEYVPLRIYQGVTFLAQNVRLIGVLGFIKFTHLRDQISLLMKKDHRIGYFARSLFIACWYERSAQQLLYLLILHLFESFSTERSYIQLELSLLETCVTIYFMVKTQKILCLMKEDIRLLLSSTKN